MKLPEFLLSPLTVTWIVALVLVVCWQRLPNVWRWTGIVLEVLMFLLMAPVGANLLVGAIESGVPSASSCQAPMPETIVLLSGGTDRRPLSGRDYASLNIASLRRLFGAVELWQKRPGARLVISGGGWHVPEADLLAGLAERMGVPPSAIQTEGDPIPHGKMRATSPDYRQPCPSASGWLPLPCICRVRWVHSGRGGSILARGPANRCMCRFRRTSAISFHKHHRLSRLIGRSTN